MRRLVQGLSSLIAAASLAIIITLVASNTAAYASGEEGGVCGTVDEQEIFPGEFLLGCTTPAGQECWFPDTRKCRFATADPVIGDWCRCKRVS